MPLPYGCCCLPTPLTIDSGGSQIFPLVVHHPAFPSNWPAIPSLQRGQSTNPCMKTWCICGCSCRNDVCRVCVCYREGNSGDGSDLEWTLCRYDLWKGDLFSIFCVFTQTYNICMKKHSYITYTSTCISTPHNSNRKKHNTHHTHFTNTRHITPLQGFKNTTINNARYTTNIPTDPHTVTTTYIQSNMPHIHTSIVSMHLATRGNNKILHTHIPHNISSEETLSSFTRRTLAQL